MSFFLCLIRLFETILNFRLLALDQHTLFTSTLILIYLTLISISLIGNTWLYTHTHTHTHTHTRARARARARATYLLVIYFILFLGISRTEWTYHWVVSDGRRGYRARILITLCAVHHLANTSIDLRILHQIGRDTFEISILNPLFYIMYTKQLKNQSHSNDSQVPAYIIVIIIILFLYFFFFFFFFSSITTGSNVKRAISHLLQSQGKSRRDRRKIRVLVYLHYLFVSLY